MIQNSHKMNEEVLDDPSLIPVAAAELAQTEQRLRFYYLFYTTYAWAAALSDLK